MGGYAYSNEWLFWTFDALPMAPAIAIVCIFHPSQYLGDHGSWRLRRPSKRFESVDLATHNDA
jgi:hypothetical protein